MKKAFAILFIAVLFFNTGAYQFFIHWLQKKSSTRLVSAIDDHHYEEAQLVEIRLPLHMPYQERYTEFERHYGEIEIGGRSYTYVKSKIQGDLLILKCIPNRAKEELKAIGDGLTQSNAGTTNEKSPAKNSLPSPLKSAGFDCAILTLAGTVSPGVYDKKNMFGQLTATLSAGFCITPLQPPDQASFL